MTMGDPARMINGPDCRAPSAIVEGVCRSSCPDSLETVGRRSVPRSDCIGFGCGDPHLGGANIRDGAGGVGDTEGWRSVTQPLAVIACTPPASGCSLSLPATCIRSGPAFHAKGNAGEGGAVPFDSHATSPFQGALPLRTGAGAGAAGTGAPGAGAAGDGAAGAGEAIPAGWLWKLVLVTRW